MTLTDVYVYVNRARGFEVRREGSLIRLGNWKDDLMTDSSLIQNDTRVTILWIAVGFARRSASCLSSDGIPRSLHEVKSFRFRCSCT